MTDGIAYKILVWVFFCAVGSFDVIGFIEGVKSVIEAIKKRSGLAWAAPLSFATSMAVAYFFRKGFGIDELLGSEIGATLFGGSTVFAIGELFGYNVVVKWLFSLADASVAGLKKKLSGGAEEGGN